MAPEDTPISNQCICGGLVSDDGSVTRLIHGIKNADEAAAAEIWQRYFHRLTALARKKLRGSPLRVSDEEDVVLSVFDSVYRGARNGTFRQLEDRNDLWQLLLVITSRKAVNHRKHAMRQKRGGGKVRGESVLAGRDSIVGGIEHIAGTDPTPEFAALVAEELRELLELLDDEVLRRIATWKMEGFTNAEIAERLGRSERTVDRKLVRIRNIWSRSRP